MKRFLPIIILFITNILSSQVTNHSEGERVFKRDFIGKHYSEVIKVFGPYESKSEDGLGGFIYVWNTQSIGSTHITDEVQFFCDADGVIYNVRYLSIPQTDRVGLFGCVLILFIYFFM